MKLNFNLCNTAIQARRNFGIGSLGIFALSLLVFLSNQSVQAEDTDSAERPDFKAPSKSVRREDAKQRFKKSRLTNDESEESADVRKLNLTAGEDKAVDLDFEANVDPKGVSIGNPAIVLPQIVRIGSQKQIVFKPLKAGETTVSVRDADGNLRLIFQIIISGSNLQRKAAEIKDLLRDIEGLEIRVIGSKVILDGQVLVPADYARLLAVVQDDSYKGVVNNLTTLSPLALQILSKRIEDDIRQFAPNVSTRVLNGIILLEGRVDNNDQAKRAVAVARLYLPDVKPGNPLLAKDPSAQALDRKPIESFIYVSPPAPKKQEKLVRVTIHFVELSKDYNRIFGFKWAPGFTSDPTLSLGNPAANPTGTTFAATISSLFPKLQNAQDAGYARIINNGTVIVRSGQPAELKQTTGYPVNHSGPNNTTVTDITEVGLSVNVTPQILGQSEDIQIDLNMSQKSVVGKVLNGAPPITSNHEVKTKLYVKSNESAAVAGVTLNNITTGFNKDDGSPGSFSNGSGGGPQTSPLLFPLLHSKGYSKQKGQFVIFVTPQIIDNASEGTEDLKKNLRIRVK